MGVIEEWEKTQKLWTSIKDPNVAILPLPDGAVQDCGFDLASDIFPFVEGVFEGKQMPGPNSIKHCYGITFSPTDEEKILEAIQEIKYPTELDGVVFVVLVLRLNENRLERVMYNRKVVAVLTEKEEG